MQAGLAEGRSPLYSPTLAGRRRRPSRDGVVGSPRLGRAAPPLGGSTTSCSSALRPGTPARRTRRAAGDPTPRVADARQSRPTRCSAARRSCLASWRPCVAPRRPPRPRRARAVRQGQPRLGSLPLPLRYGAWGPDDADVRLEGDEDNPVPAALLEPQPARAFSGRHRSQPDRRDDGRGCAPAKSFVWGDQTERLRRAGRRDRRTASGAAGADPGRHSRTTSGASSTVWATPVR